MLFTACSNKAEPKPEAEKVPEGFVKLELKGKSFQMGSTDEQANANEAPVHTVSFTRDIYICEHEVTQAEYEAIMEHNPSSFQGDQEDKKVADGENQANRPVEHVSWYMAIAYCNKRSIAENLTPCYTIEGIDFSTLTYDKIPIASSDSSDINTWNAVTCNFDANGYRLPTEAEWEYAARGTNKGTDIAVWAGTTDSNKLSEYAWQSYNSNERTHEVKKLKPNSYGLYDMSGNVHEWVWDWAADYTADKQTDPIGPKTSPGLVISQQKRILRDASYAGYIMSEFRVSHRYTLQPYADNWHSGFRVVRTVAE